MEELILNYNKAQTANFAQEKFACLRVEQDGHVLHIRLNRPHKKNALNPIILNELAFALAYAHYEKQVRAVVIAAVGDVFCAGADLKAFMGQDEQLDSSIPEPTGEILIAEMFKQVHKPTIAKVQGNVFGGGFLILANSNYVVAQRDIRLGLPETKRGVFPFQVMASLAEVMQPRRVIDWCLRGYDLSPKKALKYGLFTHLVPKGEVDLTVNQLIVELLDNSPQAINMGLKAWDHLRHLPAEKHHFYLRSMLFRSFQSEDAQEGIRAFREKEKRNGNELRISNDQFSMINFQ